VKRIPTPATTISELILVGSYYVLDGGCADGPSLGGELDMFDPRGPAPMMRAPSLKFAGFLSASEVFVES